MDEARKPATEADKMRVYKKMVQQLIHDRVGTKKSDEQLKNKDANLLGEWNKTVLPHQKADRHTQKLHLI